jgi:hypothetical protein
MLSDASSSSEQLSDALQLDSLDSSTQIQNLVFWILLDPSYVPLDKGSACVNARHNTDNFDMHLYSEQDSNPWFQCQISKTVYRLCLKFDSLK